MQIKLRGGRVTKRLTGKIKLPAGQHTEAMQTKSVEPSLEEQVIIPDSGYEGLSRVNVGRVPLQAKTATPGAAAQVVEADEGAMGLSRVTVEGVPLQSKTVAPTTGTQTVEADAGYYGLGAVEVKAAKFQGKIVTPGTAQQFITPDEGYDGLNGVAVLPEPDLIPENIKQGVTIFGVTGSYNGETSGEGGGGDNPGEGGDNTGGGSGGDNTGGETPGGGDNTGGGETIPSDLTANNFYGKWVLNDRVSLVEFSQAVEFTYTDPFPEFNGRDVAICHGITCDPSNSPLACLIYETETLAGEPWRMTVSYDGTVSLDYQKELTFPERGQSVSEVFYNWMLENATYIQAS
jgi:hypothetical protein